MVVILANLFLSRWPFSLVYAPFSVSTSGQSDFFLVGMFPVAYRFVTESSPSQPLFPGAPLVALLVFLPAPSFNFFFVYTPPPYLCLCPPSPMQQGTARELRLTSFPQRSLLAVFLKHFVVVVPLVTIARHSKYFMFKQSSPPEQRVPHFFLIFYLTFAVLSIIVKPWSFQYDSVFFRIALVPPMDSLKSFTFLAGSLCWFMAVFSDLRGKNTLL